MTAERRNWKLKDIFQGLYIIRCSESKSIFQIGYGSYLGWATDSIKQGLRVKYHILTYHEENCRYYLHEIENGQSKIRHYQPKEVRHIPMGFTVEGLCDYLNEDASGYRPATADEVINSIKTSNRNFL